MTRMWSFNRFRGRADASASLPLLLRKVPGIFWTTDTALRLTFVGGSELPLSPLGDPPQTGEPIGALFPARGAEDDVALAHAAALRGETSTVDVELQGRCLEAQISPLCESGEIQGVIGVAVDNTARRVAERALRISEQNYRSLFEDAPYAICRATPGGQLLQVNRAMAEMLRYECEQELLLRDLPQIFLDEASFEEFRSRVRQEGALQGFESRWQRRGGEAILVTLGARSISDHAGRTLYIEVFAENVSRRKQLEEQLRHAQKMQAVGQLAGGVAHDFNNILMVISSQIELALEETPDFDSRRKRLEETQKAAARAAALTRKLLAFSRRQLMETKVLDLNAIISGMNEMLSRLIGENIEFQFEPAADLWSINADSSQIEQVLMNLAVNSRDAMPLGGRFRILTRNVRVPGPIGRAEPYIRAGEYVCLNVSDSGCGMAPETRERIFEPFYTTKAQGKGTGLGLAMVYGIVKQSGGYIWVESEPGRGATFEIYLPRGQGAPERSEMDEPLAIPGGNETILLVEDEESVREILAEFLKRRGYRILSAADGLAAKRLISDGGGRVDLLLTDVVMPGIGGFELAEELRKSDPALKIVCMSGYSGGRSTAGETGFDEGFAFVQKPFSMQFMARKIRELFDETMPRAASPAGRPGHA